MALYSVTTGRCGDGVCDGYGSALDETCGNCPDDCGPCQQSADLTSCVERGVLAYSFEGGPTSLSPVLLTALSSLQVQATFFYAGDNVAVWPDAVRQAVSAGHYTSSGTYEYPLPLTNLTPSAAAADFYRSRSVLRNVTCARPTLYRPPDGMLADSHRAVAQAAGLRAVTWNVDTFDSSLAGSHPDWVTGNFTATLDLMWPLGILVRQTELTGSSIGLVPVLVAAARAHNYQLVSVDRCVWGANYTRHPSWVYAYGNCDGNSSSGLLHWYPGVVWPDPAGGCPVSDWGEWSACDAACDVGTQTRARLTMPPSLRTTTACASVRLVQSRQCTGAATSCPQPGGPCVPFSDWAPWTSAAQCSSCGVGTRREYRRVLSSGDTNASFTFPVSQLTADQVALINSNPLQCGPVSRVTLCESLCPGVSMSSAPQGLSLPTIIGFSMFGVLAILVVLSTLYLKYRLHIGIKRLEEAEKAHMHGHGGHGHGHGGQPPPAAEPAPAPAAAPAASPVTITVQLPPVNAPGFGGPDTPTTGGTSTSTPMAPASQHGSTGSPSLTGKIVKVRDASDPTAHSAMLKVPSLQSMGASTADTARTGSTGASGGSGRKSRRQRPSRKALGHMGVDANGPLWELGDEGEPDPMAIMFPSTPYPLSRQRSTATVGTPRASPLDAMDTPRSRSRGQHTVTFL